MTNQALTVYGADWCGDCRRTKRFLDENNMPYTWVDTDDNKDAEEFVKQQNNGKRIIPTLIFADGSMLVEPSNAELAEKLGITVQVSG